MNTTRSCLLSGICLACLAMAARADDPSAPIRDEADLFHADAIARVERRIDNIRRTFDRNVFVQTVASAWPQKRRLFPFLKRTEANRLLEEQARKYADESGQPGIYVVICRKPHDVHVIVRPDNDPFFTHHDAEMLRRTLARRLAESGSDAALLGLVEQVHAILQGHASRGDTNSVVNEFVLAGLLGGGLALWLLLSMIRFKMRAARPDTASEEDAAAQTRGGPALLGAMFGFPAGMWVYDKLYPCPEGTPQPLCEAETEPSLATEDENTEAMDAETHPRHEHAEDAPVSP